MSVHAEKNGIQEIIEQIPLVSLFIALVAIPGAVFVAIVCDLAWPQLIYGKPNALMVAGELGSIVALIALVMWLRWRLQHEASARFYVHVMDFFALRHWHMAVKVAFAGLIILPGAWFWHTSHWMLIMFLTLGRRALAMSDIQNALDGVAVLYQLALIGGLPLLFFMHLVCRWRPRNRVLPWILLPLLFACAVIATVVVGTMAHFGD